MVSPKGSHLPESVRRQISISGKKRWADRKYRARQRRARKRSWANPVVRANHLRVLRSPEARIKASETSRVKWRDPEIRGRVEAGCGRGGLRQKGEPSEKGVRPGSGPSLSREEKYEHEDH